MSSFSAFFRIPPFTAPVALLSLALAAPALAQAPAPPKHDKASLLAAAREVIAAQTYCALATLDASGGPNVRTMNPFPPDEDMVVWMATSTQSRKVAQIRKDPRVALYYADHKNPIGEVTIVGRAELVTDMDEILKRKRAYWDQAFPGLKNLTLIKVIPERVEVVHYKAGLNGDPTTFAAPAIEFGPAKP
jgi:general stress protein 26